MVSRKTEQMAQEICMMDRMSLMQRLRGMRCDFPIDFSDEYLNSISLERLQHIVLAAAVHEHLEASVEIQRQRS